MPRLFTHHSTARTAGSERVFTDDRGRLGSAAPIGCGTPEAPFVLRPAAPWPMSTPPLGTLP
jgi:hypothetical protein